MPIFLERYSSFINEKPFLKKLHINKISKNPISKYSITPSIIFSNKFNLVIRKTIIDDIENAVNENIIDMSITIEKLLSISPMIEENIAKYIM